MAYTTINNLPIVQVDDLSGNEYIMVTDEDTNISSKFTLESLVQYTGENFDNTVDQKLNAKVDKIPGKGLSTEDFTSEEKFKLSTLQNYTHPTSAVIPGSYTKVTVNSLGHVVDASHPTTLEGYTIEDAYTKTEVQTALDGKVDDTEKGSANGVATLDVNGKVTITQIPDSVLGQLEYQGVWDFTTLPTATQKGQYWIASVSGNGYVVGDWAVWNGTAFDKVDNTDAVASVAGRTGNVVLTKSDVGLDLVDNTADVNKNVLSATKWTTPRNIALTGDVTGNVNIDGSANVSIATTIALNSVALGTDTTGNYVAGATAGTGISISGTAGEGWSPTITNTAPNVTTDISITHNASSVVVNSSDGLDGTINAATSILAGIMTAADKTKLDGIATGATGPATITAGSGLTGGGLGDVTLSVNGGKGILVTDDNVYLNGSEIPAGVNLNTYRTTGIYCQNANADTSLALNYPVAVAGILQVWNDDYGNGLHTVQLYSIYNTSQIFHRTYYNGTWSSWRDLTIDTTYSNATTSVSGLMSNTDKTKLDGIATGATSNTGTVTSIATTGAITGGTITTTGTISHSTADGFLHVPATGTTNNGKVLTAGATAGSLSWTTIPSGITDHTLLSNIGTNTHTQIDTALTRLSNTSGTNTGDQTITLTGDVTGTGTGSFATTLSNSGATPGSYSKVTVDAKGRVTAGLIPTMEDIPDATFKRSVKAATTANITLSATQTIDGIVLAVGDRVLVKDQTTTSQNGIYVVSATAWTRALDADTASKIASALVAVDSGTVNGGKLFDNDFKTTDTLGTTAMLWASNLDSGHLLASTSASIGTVAYNGTTDAAGKFDGGTTTPTGTSRLNYGGYFYPTYINLVGSADTATASSHVFVETGADGFVRPKTLANFKTEMFASPTLVTPNIGVATGTSFNSITGLASVAPLVAGTATVGTSTLTARQDHVHPAQTSVSGNAGTATALQTARTINGVAFDGTANITIPVQTSITTTEFITEMVRNTKQVYGKEVDIGLMPNATVKDVAFAFNALYTYWIDNQNSYCANSSASYPINYAGNIGESISCYLDRTNNIIKVLTSDDKSTFTGKVILLYTK